MEVDFKGAEAGYKEYPCPELVKKQFPTARYFFSNGNKVGVLAVNEAQTYGWFLRIMGERRMPTFAEIWKVKLAFIGEQTPMGITFGTSEDCRNAQPNTVLLREFHNMESNNK
jgi:hypothetical protein